MNERPRDQDHEARSVPNRIVDGAEREILEFVAGQPFVLASQLRMLLSHQDAGLVERLDGMEAAGLICAGPRMRHQAAYQITARGLAEIESDLPIPRVDLRSYWHDVGVAWLMVAVRRGMFGPVERVYSRHEMLEADRRAAHLAPAIDAEWSEAVRAKAADALFGLSIGGEGSEPPGVHYPGLVLVLPEGRLAMEFFWDPPDDRILANILDAYVRKLTVGAAIFFCVDSAVGEQLRAATAAHGLDDRVRIEQTTLSVHSTQRA